jgi:hypothetical protein
MGGDDCRGSRRRNISAAAAFAHANERTAQVMVLQTDGKNFQLKRLS